MSDKDLFQHMLNDIGDLLHGKASVDKDGNIIVRPTAPDPNLPPLVGYGDTVRVGDIINLYESDESGEYRGRRILSGVEVRGYDPVDKGELLAGSRKLPTLRYNISASVCLANPNANRPFWRTLEVVSEKSKQQGEKNGV